MLQSGRVTPAGTADLCPVRRPRERQGQSLRWAPYEAQTEMDKHVILLQEPLQLVISPLSQHHPPRMKGGDGPAVSWVLLVQV